MSELSDDDIVAAVRAGDVESYALLVRRHQGEVWKVAAALLRERHQTEDIVQQVFIKVYFALDRFEAGRPFVLWVKEIARNEARQELRRLEREGRRLDFYGQHLLTEGLDEAGDGERARLEEMLRRCREELAPHVGEVMAQRYQLGLSFEDIAARLGRTVEATRQMLSRARVALRDCVERMGGAS
jgi:RNA polymerase sigma-70 factor (ECF subfamily)